MNDSTTSLPPEVVHEISRFGESVSAAIKIARRTQRAHPEIMVDRPITEPAPKAKEDDV
jgi:hypothetical protein